MENRSNKGLLDTVLANKLLFEAKDLKKTYFAPTSEEMYIRNYLEEMGINIKLNVRLRTSPEITKVTVKQNVI